MPRRPRLVLPGVPIHLLQRGVDRQACFLEDADRRAYLDDLAEIAADVGERRPSTLLFAAPRSTEIDRHGAR